MLTIIVFILMLGILVLVHEFGHFIMAKKNGMLVEEFGIGFPPRLLGKKIGETIYSLNLIPLGGFVKIYGEEYKELSDAKSLKNKPNLNRTFAYKKPLAKASVVIAGVIGNFLLAWVLISFLFTQGVPTPTNQVLIEKVQPNSPAQASGLKNNDFIYSIAINGKEHVIRSTNDFINLTKQSFGQTMTLIVNRDNKKLSFNLIPRKNPPKGQGAIGVVITSFIEKKYPWFEAPFFGLIESFKITRQILIELGSILFKVITLQNVKVDVSGPIGIASYTGQAIKFGRNAVLELIALLSLNLAVINILPFPALDGGRLVFVIYEWVTKKRVNKNLENFLNLFGIVVLLSIAVLISINDILKLIK